MMSLEFLPAPLEIVLQGGQMNSRALTIVTHVASQLMYRWIPPVSNDDFVHLPPFDVEAARERDWLEFISYLTLTSDYVNSWWPKFQKKMRDDGRQLAAAIYTHLAAIRMSGAHYVVYSDESYPQILRHMTDAPLGLTFTGDPSLFDRVAVSVVGSRKASPFAIQQSQTVGTMLAERGVVVVSGGAFGCDIAAHFGVLAGGIKPAPAICVFAGGLQSLYPRSNYAIFAKLQGRSGIMLTERLWQAPCRPADFTARNRIIAGLSRITLVMQAAQRSGALVTARRALDQGADVYVLQHPADDIRAVGSHALMGEGAPTFADGQDLLRQLDGDL